MKHKSIYNAAKRAGATILHEGRHFTALKANRSIHWVMQDGAAICVRTKSPHTDIMTDCFCDRWHHTIKSAISSLEG